MTEKSYSEKSYDELTEEEQRIYDLCHKETDEYFDWLKPYWAFLAKENLIPFLLFKINKNMQEIINSLKSTNK